MIEQASAGERLDVILPAGGRISGPFAEAAGTEIKALIRLADRTVLHRTVETLRSTGRVERIVVVGPEEALQEARVCGADGALPEGTTGPENALRGMEWLRAQAGSRPYALVMATDLPFLTLDSLTGFLDNCPPSIDLALPLVTEEAFTTRFPGSPSTFERLRDGSFTLGCVFRVRSDALLGNRAHLERVFAARKSPRAMVQLLGVRILWRFATRSLTIADIEGRCQAMLRCTGAAVRNAPAELAYDIDTPEDFAHAQAHSATEENQKR